jgi:hypothetical protein
MGEFSVKSVAGAGNSLFHSLAILLETVSYYSVSGILQSMQKKCYVVLSKIAKYVEIQRALTLVRH